MDFQRIVAPLVSYNPSQIDKVNFGSGFLVRVNNEIFLATVAHLADPILAPRSDWTKWSEEIHLVNPTSGTDGGAIDLIETYPLFTEDLRGQRSPVFKYHLREDKHGTIVDAILIPVPHGSHLKSSYQHFDLPNDIGSHRPLTEVLQLGRRDEFPALNVSHHLSTTSSGPLRFAAPEGRSGDSGGPAVDLDGHLLGLNVGSHAQAPEQAMMMSPEAIEAIANSKDGVAPNWPQFQ